MNTAHSQSVDAAFRLARQRYADLGVDVDDALQRLQQIPLSVQCWQGDDVGGFENAGQTLGGGLAVTGNFPGKARSAEELRQDLELVYSLVPGSHRMNLHAMYSEFDGQRADRNEIGPEHFANWISWAKAQGLGLDFNPTYFSHPKANDGFTLSHTDPQIRKFWIEHGIRCRQIGAAMGTALQSPCVTNFWIPDGFKDTPIDRKGPRERLADSLDQIFRERLPAEHQLDAVESKLFGIGSECYTSGSHEFYLGYAITRQKVLCVDSGHFHPTESIADKISSVLQFVPRLLLHVSRGVRWDSDHVVTYSDELQAIALELVRGDFLGRTHIGLDYFDASINRVAAWVIGMRSMLKALLFALLEPTARLREAEASGDFTYRLMLLEEIKTMPLGAVWDYYCETAGVPVGPAWLATVKSYESKTLFKR
ncbi:MAG: L-rhamnose isomerase [Pirellulaceae bacterium]